ncbi:hypothetical protein ACXGQW_03635 [Wenyingzhuangia sp. IMCC45533]
MKLTKTLLAATFAVSALAQAQEAPKFSLSGEFRPRTELFGNGQSATALEGSTGVYNTSIRAALNADYASQGYKLHIGVQEVFLFGDRPQISPSGNGNFRVQEAWADIKLSESTSLKLGRQPLSYDDQRILGGLGWAQQARTHDAAIIKYKNNGYSLDLGGSLSNTTPGTGIYSRLNAFSYRDMGFVHANKKYDALNLSFLGMVNTFQNGTDRKATLGTVGLHADYSINSLKLKANAFIQDGERYDITQAATPAASGVQEVEGAYLVSLDATFKATEKLTVLAGGEIISGRTDDGTFGFAPLYGTNHAFNGLMDRFFVGNYVNGPGLIDLNLGVKTNISGYAVSLKGHNFSQQSGNEDNIGQELDLVIAKKFNGFKLVGGYSQFFEGDTEPANAESTQNWAWLMLIIKPKFL